MADAEAKVAEEAVEGVVAKAIKGSVRDAEKVAARDTTETATKDVAKDAGKDVDLTKLPDYHQGGQPDLFGSQNVPADYQPYGDLSRQEFYNQHWNEAEGHWDYPPDDGFAGPREPTTLQPGDTVDRYGMPGGQYTSPAGTSFEQRALPPTNLTAPYYRYEVVRPLPSSVTEGPIAPAFEQPGGGVQHFFDKSVDEYVRQGYLKQVYP